MSTPPTTQDRAAMIGRRLGVSRPFSSEASGINDRFQEAIADIGRLDPDEQTRLLSGLIAQLGGKLGQLHP